MANRTALNITTSGARPLDDIVSDLEEAGLEELQILEAIGVVTGSAEEDCVERLRKVPGVSAVEPDIAIDIGPPGSAETW